MKVLQLTGVCHRQCLYCMDEYKNIKHSDIEKIMQMIPKIKDKYILLTGGEPLLIKEINEIIDELYKYDKVITLHTEGSLIKKLTQDSLKKIKCISLPLDSVYSDENKNLKRDEKQYEICMQAIEYVEEYCNIRVSSVATKCNQAGIIELANILEEKKIEWRVYELNPVGSAVDNLDLIKLEQNKLDQLFKQIKTIKPDVKLMNISDDYGDYYYINPKLKLMHYKNNEYKFIEKY